ncbi:MAG TPA: hypothetical protein VGX25_28845 [Actinophytocola sp.]|uniref:hypothetical protein n=1 Tax=Actinophytocola sp. TaxID=1872138 RepID=UPI002DDCFA6E|nr:hypothetical protein [Actinophytocola sp.]HEV2783411.1 hypothetical protein [Actinophytocola sp.]
MSEQELREGLRAALVDEPALSFDPDMLITRARRESARRRTLVAAGVATTAVAVAAVAVPTIIGVPRAVGPAGPGPDDPVPATPCATVPKPTMPLEKLTKTPLPTDSKKVEPGKAPKTVVPPAEPKEPAPFDCVPLTGKPTPPSGVEPPKPVLDLDWPPAGVTPAHYTAEQLRQRGTEMWEYLSKRFAEVVPDATQIAPGEFGGEAAGAVADGQTYLEAFTGFTLNNARSAVDIWISAPGAEGVSPVENCPADVPPGCKVDKRADGSFLVIKEESGGAREASILSVTHYRANGTAVRATGYNYDPTAHSAPTYLEDIPVTVDQLVALATDPALSL